jgi:hypothetical protein
MVTLSIFSGTPIGSELACWSRPCSMSWKMILVTVNNGGTPYVCMIEESGGNLKRGTLHRLPFAAVSIKRNNEISSLLHNHLFVDQANCDKFG